MATRIFTLVALVSTENPAAIKHALRQLMPKASIAAVEDGFVVKTNLAGPSARDLNRDLLSALRRVERKTRLRADWASGAVVERFFDYVPKGTRKA